MINIYTLPDCISCEQTKRYLDLRGVEYNVMQLKEEKAQEARDAGWGSAPIVEANGVMWGGFSIERMKEHILEA
jgi:glutaredoxin-like protein NrdH